MVARDWYMRFEWEKLGFLRYRTRIMARIDWEIHVRRDKIWVWEGSQYEHRIFIIYAWGGTCRDDGTLAEFSLTTTTDNIQVDFVCN